MSKNYKILAINFYEMTQEENDFFYDIRSNCQK